MKQAQQKPEVVYNYFDQRYKNLYKTLKLNQKAKIWFLAFVGLHENLWRERSRRALVLAVSFFFALSVATVVFFGVGPAVMNVIGWLIFVPAIVQVSDAKQGRCLKRPTYLQKYEEKLLNIK